MTFREGLEEVVHDAAPPAPNRSRRTRNSQQQRRRKRPGRLVAAERTSMRAQDVLRDLRIVADKCMGRIPILELVKVKKPVGRGRKAKLVDVEEVREKWIWDASAAITALVHLGRHLRLFTDVVDSRRHEEALDELLRDTERLVPDVGPSGTP